MKIQGALIQGALAAVALGASYFTWQREPEKAPGDVMVIEATKSDVARVRFEDDKSWVELYRSDDGVWLKLSAREQPKTPEREVRGNEAAERLLESFAPLRASRALGVVDEKKLKEFGLAPQDAPDAGSKDNPAAPFKKKRIEVTARSDKRAFTAGSPPGAFATYLREERDGRVYLVNGTVVSDLESAPTRMVERGLHSWKQGDFDALTVEAGGKKREFVVLPGENAYSVKLAAKKSPDKADETAKNWHDKLFRQYPIEVLGKGETPSAGAPAGGFKVTYFQAGKEKGFVEIGKLSVQPPAPAVPPGQSQKPEKDAAAPQSLPPPQTELYARSEHTAGWTKLGGTAEDLIKDAEKLAAGE